MLRAAIRCRRFLRSRVAPWLTRTSSSRRPTETASQRLRLSPRSRVGKESLSCPTSEASTASTRSSRSASPSGESQPSRSTISAEPQGSTSGGTTSTTRPMSRRRLPRASRRTSAPLSSTCDPPPSRSSRSASASAAATRGSPRPTGTAWRARSASTASRRSASRRGRPSAPARWSAPILALQAGDDQNITAEDNAAFEQALTEAGVEHELVTYDGAPHSFFDRKQEEFADASADAWERVLPSSTRRARRPRQDQLEAGTTFSDRS